MIVGDIAKLPEGGCSLSLVLNDKAGIMDDVIFSKHNNFMYINKKLSFECWK